ncbi:MAG: tyrosine-type recombinase/integrase [Brevibacterium sp. UMB1308B]|nr:tyrosine-type recombinase/integrase [Brevibacterium sp. UMB1308B]
MAEHLHPYRPGTRKAKIKQLRSWVRFCQAAGVPPLEATPTLIEDWINSMVATGVAIGTQSVSLSTLRIFYAWCARRGYVEDSPAKWVRVVGRSKRSSLEQLGASEVSVMLEAAEKLSPEAHLVFCFYALNGLRSSEALTARVEHLSERDGRTILLLPDRKFGHSDHIALPGRTVKAWGTVVGDKASGPVFKGKLSFLRMWVLRTCRQLEEVTGIPHITPRILRASFATIALDHGASERDVSVSLGHAGTRSLAPYDRGWRSVHRNVSGVVAGVVEAQK